MPATITRAELRRILDETITPQLPPDARARLDVWASHCTYVARGTFTAEGVSCPLHAVGFAYMSPTYDPLPFDDVTQHLVKHLHGTDRKLLRVTD